MSKAETIIREAITNVRAKGIRIQPGAMIDWTGEGGTPVSCDALGAVALHHDIASKSFPSGWLKKLCTILGEDTFWVYRFCMGFDRKYQILIIEDERSKVTRDEVSALGIRLRKEFGAAWCR